MKAQDFTTVTIPKKLAQHGELILVSRREYEALLGLRTTSEFKPTKTQISALARAERNLKSGRSLSYHELTRSLGFTN